MTTTFRWTISCVAAGCLCVTAAGLDDSDNDGLPDPADACPTVVYAPTFDWQMCDPMDLDPSNDVRPECKARERVMEFFQTNGAFNVNISFMIADSSGVRFADAYEYVGNGVYVHDPEGIHRLFRVGSTSKSVVTVAAKVLESEGVLSLDDFVSDDDATRVLAGGERTLRQLLSHNGAFGLDSGAIHLFCYPNDLVSFWEEPSDGVSPHYDSPNWGNLGGGYEYSAFNYSLAGAYLATQSGESFQSLAQTRVFDASSMCTATLDDGRAASSSIGSQPGISQSSSMHLGPYINLLSQGDPLCEDNFYNSDDLPTDEYSYQGYFLDEASGDARDPAGGVIASAVDLGQFCAMLLSSYHGTGGILSPEDVRELWRAHSVIGCGQNCAYQPYYGLGFFTNSLTGDVITEVEHGGSRAGFKCGMVLRPEADLAVAILVNADVSTVDLSNLAKTILDDLESFDCDADVDGSGDVDVNDLLALLSGWSTDAPGAEIAAPHDIIDVNDLLALLSAWGPCSL